MLGLDEKTRRGLWAALIERLEALEKDAATRSVVARHDAAKSRAELRSLSFAEGTPPETAFQFVMERLAAGTLNTSHPRYFGVFNPKPADVSVFGEALVAALNPQLASYVSGGWALDAEQRVLDFFGEKFGYAQTEGTFTHGGTEANHTALLLALHEKFPSFAKDGARSLPKMPRLYVSTEAHHSFLKAARATGLGETAVREIPVGRDLKMRVDLLEQAIREDQSSGRDPFFVGGTLGTTSAGVIEDLTAIGATAKRHGLWFHVDAAWGGAAILVPELTRYLQGTTLSDSLTLDAHKWLCVPMTAGMLMTQHPGALERAFRVGHTPYMPPVSQRADSDPQPYAQSLSWSRRALGLKLFLSLLAAGESGYAETLSRMTALAQLLRKELIGKGWKILNETPLPVVCFTRPGLETAGATEAFCRQITETGEAWITTTVLGEEKTPALRAGVVNYLTTEADIKALVQIVSR